MKGSVAAFLASAARIPTEQLSAPLYFVCTADEEIGFLGAKDVVARSALYREMVRDQTVGIIGEPTRLEVVYAHKGACSAQVISRGRAAHSSTREGLNANWAMIPFLAEMERIHCELETDPAWIDPEFDPPDVRLNLCVTDHAPALNITPPETVCRLAFRPMPGQPVAQLLDRIRNAAAAQGLEFTLTWNEPALRTDPQSDFIQDVLRLAGRDTPRSVGFGTDGSSFGEMRHLVVIGPGDIAQAHTDDEWIALEQLHAGVNLYDRLIRHWCCATPKA